MSAVKKSSVQDVGSKAGEHELVQVEARAKPEDADLLRRIAAILLDPELADDARAVLKQLALLTADLDFKQFLGSGPSLDGLDLERRTGVGREVDP